MYEMVTASGTVIDGDIEGCVFTCTTTDKHSVSFYMLLDSKLSTYYNILRLPSYLPFFPSHFEKSPMTP